METNLYTRQDAYRFDETEESVLQLRRLITSSELSTYYVCAYTAMEHTVPLTIISETCDYEEAKIILKNAVESEVASTNDMLDEPLDPEQECSIDDFIEYFVIYNPNADVFIAFGEDFEQVIGIHPANFLRKNEVEFTVKSAI
jgi:predicted nucleic acid-binding protein